MNGLLDNPKSLRRTVHPNNNQRRSKARRKQEMHPHQLRLLLSKPRHRPSIRSQMLLLRLLHLTPRLHHKVRGVKVANEAGVLFLLCRYLVQELPRQYLRPSQQLKRHNLQRLPRRMRRSLPLLRLLKLWPSSTFKTEAKHLHQTRSTI